MKQHLFDLVAAHLLIQNQISTDLSDKRAFTCMYRGSDGLKCAIGALITDENYTTALEGKSLSSQSVLDALYKSVPYNVGSYMDLLIQLQAVHDRTMPELWSIQLRELAKRFSLDDTIVGVVERARK